MSRFERTVSVLGRSASTFNNYSRHLASISLYFGKIPTELDPEQVQDYLFYLQKKSKTPSQTYFKHCVYGLRFLLKSEGIPYEYLRLPSIKHEKKLPVVLSKEEVWAMLKNAKLLKHRILIGLLYGCGLRCMEVRSVRLQDLDFDRKQLKVVQGKGKKDRYVPQKVLEKVEKKPFLPKCPCCKTGNLHRIAVFDQRGPPAWYLGGGQNTIPCKS